MTSFFVIYKYIYIQRTYESGIVYNDLKTVLKSMVMYLVEIICNKF